jgi:hypothetical protein
MGAWKVFQHYGKRVELQEEHLKELEAIGKTGQLGNVESQVLFSELDDVWLPMQKEKRSKQGTLTKSKQKRTRKRPMHIGTAYTGWVKEKDGSYKTVDKVAYASFEDTSKFASKFETILRHCFDKDNVKHIVINGDGASWIKTVSDSNDAILQLDPFHRSRAILRAVYDKNDRKALNRAIEEKDVKTSLEIIFGLIAKAQDELSRERLKKLYNYFYSNKDTLLTWQERGIELPEPPKGIYYRNLGVQESSNCNLLTQRMKHRKGSWSINGANHMAKILCFRYTIGLDAMLGILPEPALSEIQLEPLSSTKTPQYDGNGYDGTWLYADMPFEHTFKTNGREAIRKILKMKPISDLSFI